MQKPHLGLSFLIVLAACGESEPVHPAPDARAPSIDAGIVDRPGAPVDAGDPAIDAAIDAAIADRPDASADAGAIDAPAPCPDCRCIPAAPTIAVTPRISEPTPAGTPAIFDVTITSNDSPSCPGVAFELRTRVDVAGLTLDPTFFGPKVTPVVPGGATAHLTIAATPAALLEGQSVDIGFDVIASGSQEQPVGDVVQLVVAEPMGCHVSIVRELMINDLSVVDDPIRTSFDGDAGDPRTGAWTFKRLVEAMAPSPSDAPRMVEAMLATFTTPQTVNGFVVPERPALQGAILDAWPRTADGALDLRAAPFQLQAIVNRFDLRDLDRGDAGEARFVFAFMSEGFPLEATMIFEYKLPAANEAEVLAWAQSFHALGGLRFSEEYNAALQAISDRFAGRGARPTHQNGSAISAVRTNEIAFGGPWELRQFALSPATGMLVPAPVELTPDIAFNGSDVLARFVNANAAAIIAERHTVPDVFEGRPFRGGAVVNRGSWDGTGILDAEARHHFALNTCNGCHSGATGTGFLHIRPRFPGFGRPAGLSRFLTGVTVSDGVTERTFDDLGRRRADLAGVVCPPAGALRAPVNLRRGIARVH